MSCLALSMLKLSIGKYIKICDVVCDRYFEDVKSDRYFKRCDVVCDRYFKRCDDTTIHVIGTTKRCDEVCDRYFEDVKSDRYSKRCDVVCDRYSKRCDVGKYVIGTLKDVLTPSMIWRMRSAWRYVIGTLKMYKKDQCDRYFKRCDVVCA